MDWSVRRMVLGDLPQVLEIEIASFPNPLSADHFRHELTANQIATYLVAYQGNTVLGYVGVWLIVGEIHITTIAVQQDHRRKGIGELLIISVVNLALEHGAQLITLEVRESNLIARALYRKYGFEEVGLRRRYYTETGEDAIIMSVENITSASFQDEFQRLKRANAS
jgi:[ribosomal protein S18]-alanine N-acetyltransferase